MSPVSRPDGPVTTPRGEIQADTIPRLFVDLAAQQATGTLVVSSALPAAVRRTVSFRAGRVQFATSTDRDDRFNQVLIKAGVIKLRDLLRALEVALATRDRLGEVLVRMKLLSPSEVETWVKVQVRNILSDLFEQPSGEWSFEAGPVAVESIRLDLPGESVTVGAIRQVRSWSRVYEQVGGLNAEYLQTRRAAGLAPTLDLEAGEQALLDQCRVPTSLGEMCDASAMGDFEVCRAVWGLVLAGALMKS
jgi:hypothetical protein